MTETTVSGPTEAKTTRQQAFFSALDRVEKVGSYPRFDLFDPIDYWACVGYLHKIEWVREQDDFRYRTYGSEVARYASLEMTGKLVSEHPGQTGRTMLANYRELRAAPRLVRTEIEAFGVVATPRWTRLVCPAVDTEGTVVGFLVLAEPVLPNRPTTTPAEIRRPGGVA